MDDAGERSGTADLAEQINCHFIFNALNTLKYSVITDKPGACSLIDDIAAYMQYRIRAVCGFEMVFLSEEIRNTESYINLEQARFSYVSAEYNLDDTDFTLPSMSVIFLVENAIHHGLLAKKNGGKVHIKSYRDSQFHYAEVCDNGTGIGEYNSKYPESSNNGIGNLAALAMRIESMAGGSLLVESVSGEGTRAVIKIPI
ncbi:MAG: histidine kinase [Lachnospiraceae bacterium]